KTRSGRTLQANIDGITELRLFGWARGAGPDACEIELLCDGRPIAAPVWRADRADVDAALGAGEHPLGFEIDLPPSIWRDARDAVARLQLRVDGDVLPRELEVAAQDVDALVELAVAVADGDRRRTLLCRALAHLRALGRAEALSPAAAAAFEEIADKGALSK